LTFRTHGLCYNEARGNNGSKCQYFISGTKIRIFPSRPLLVPIIPYFLKFCDISNDDTVDVDGMADATFCLLGMREFHLKKIRFEFAKLVPIFH
jgi:hypothetical protein